MSPEERAKRLAVRTHVSNGHPARKRLVHNATEEFRSARADAFREAAEVEPIVVGCPACGAHAGRACRGIGFPHRDRWRAAIRALIPKEAPE